MMGATLSFLGLYRADDQLFSMLQVPAGVNKDLLIDNLLLDSAELEVIYPDPEFMKNALGIYSGRQVKVWESLAKTFDLEYNPIWNVDADIRETETRDLKHADKGTEEKKDSRSGSSKESGSGKNDSTLTVERAGFNSSSYGADEKQTASGSASSTVNKTDAESGTLTSSDERCGSDTGTIQRDTRRTGNIGTTMTQTMLQAELDIRPKLNIYSYIIEDLKSRFCLLVY